MKYNEILNKYSTLYLETYKNPREINLAVENKTNEIIETAERDCDFKTIIEMSRSSEEIEKNIINELKYKLKKNQEYEKREKKEKKRKSEKSIVIITIISIIMIYLILIITILLNWRV